MRNRHDVEWDEVTSVSFAKTAPYPRKVAKKACIKEGLEFEAKAQSFLTRKFSGEHFGSKWITYTCGGKVFHAQPDHFTRVDGKLFIFEMKLRHTPRSAAQLAKYGELLNRLFPEDEIILVEVYKYWDWVVYPAESERVVLDALFEHSCEKIALVHLPLEER